MKIWTMPRVSIEAFTPNEYVATCKEFASVVNSMNSNGVYYIDMYSGGYKFHYDSPYEQVGPCESDGGWLVNSSVPEGWQDSSSHGTGIVYSYSGSSAPRNDILYSSSGFTSISGKVYVYVLNVNGTKKAYIYKNKYNIPTVNKAFSS